MKGGSPCPLAAQTNWTDNNKSVEKSRGAFVHDGDHENKLTCQYTNLDSDTLKSIHGEIQSDEPDSSARKKLYIKARDKFCTYPENLYEKINSSQTCNDIQENKEMARLYCALGDNIKTNKASCTAEELGSGAADELAQQYCSTRKNDKWCGCYNVLNGVCKTNPTAAGCVEHLARLKDLETDGFDITKIQSKPQCYSMDCGSATASIWTPISKPDQMDCPANFNVCNMAIEQGISMESSTTAECNITDVDVTNNTRGSGASGASGAPGDQWLPDAPGDKKEGFSTTTYILALVILILCIGVAAVAVL